MGTKILAQVDILSLQRQITQQYLKKDALIIKTYTQILYHTEKEWKRQGIGTGYF